MTTTYEAADAAIFLPTKPLADVYVSGGIYEAHAELMESVTIGEGCEAFSRIARACMETTINGQLYRKRYSADAYHTYAPVLGDLGFRNTMSGDVVATLHAKDEHNTQPYFRISSNILHVLSASLVDPAKYEFCRPIVGTPFDTLRWMFNTALAEKTIVTPLGALLKSAV